jgi:hypothetical protein
MSLTKKTQSKNETGGTRTVYLTCWRLLQIFVSNIQLGRYARVAARAVGLRACVWYMYLYGLNVHQNVQLSTVALSGKYSQL